MFRNAQLVFTGTFHGVVFSIKSKKNFYCYLTNPSRVRKVESLLKQLNINNRIITEKNIKETLSKIVYIDYNKIFENIEIEKNESLRYLTENIV